MSLISALDDAQDSASQYVACLHRHISEMELFLQLALLETIIKTILLF